MPTQPAETRAQIFEQHRGLLFSIAYRMLGSVMEAEDMVQEAYLRYEKAHDKDVQSPKAYLTTIITRLCLDRLKSARMQRENYVGMWLPEPVLTDSSPGALLGEHESISIAFLVLLENLSPVERAIFLLHDVFEYSFAEIARMVDKSEANCRRYYRRAKQFLVERRPRFEPSTDEQRRLVEGFLQAMATGDVEGLTQMLAEDVVFYGDGGGKVSAVRQPIIGREAVKRFLLLGIYRLLPPGVHLEVAEVNGSPALLLWGYDVHPYFVMTFTFAGNRILAIRNILNPDKLTHIHHDGVQSPSAPQNDSSAEADDKAV
jgi:RNA polymerase sigma-70 factor (ECF subfamily)